MHMTLQNVCTMMISMMMTTSRASILLTYNFRSIVSCSFCIILYINRIHSLHRCNIVCLFFIALLSYHFGRTFKFVFEKPKKRTTFLCSSFFFRNDSQTFVVMMDSIVDMLANYFISAIFLFK